MVAVIILINLLFVDKYKLIAKSVNTYYSLLFVKDFEVFQFSYNNKILFKVAFSTPIDTKEY